MERKYKNTWQQLVEPNVNSGRKVGLKPEDLVLDAQLPLRYSSPCALGAGHRYVIHRKSMENAQQRYGENVSFHQ